MLDQTAVDIERSIFGRSWRLFEGRMINSKAVLTYKRKRFSSQSHLALGIKEANYSPDSRRGISFGRFQPKVESDSHNEKLNEDNNIPQNIVQCSTSIRRHDSEESMQQQVQQKKRMRKRKSIETSEIGPMRLRSQRVLLSKKLAENGSKKAKPSATNVSDNKKADSFSVDFSCDNSGLACDITCVEGTSRSKLTDVGIIRSSSVCLNSSTERSSSGFPKESILRSLNSDSILFEKEHPKGTCSTPLITFCRRVKKKPVSCETSIQRSLKAENHCLSAYWSSHALEANNKDDDSSKKCNLKDQSTTADILLEQANLSSLQLLQQDMVTDADKDVTTESAPAGGFLKAKIASDMRRRSPIHSAEGSNSNKAEHVHEDLSDKCTTEPTIDTIQDSILMQENRQSDSNEIGTVLQELGNQFIIDVNKSEKMITPHDVSEERCHLNDLNLSVAPPSPLNAFPNNMELIKPSTDVEPENLQESQSSSTPSCAVVLDDESDGKGKEMEWLKSLDKALQETKKNRNTCQVGEPLYYNCGHASGGRVSPTIPIKSLVACNQDESKEYMNQTSPLQEREFLSGAGEPDCKKQQHEGTSNFLGLSLPVNSEAPVGSVKDFQNMPLQLSLGLQETDQMNRGQIPWHVLDENSSLLRHKQIVDDVITGTRMLKERQGSLLDKYKRYSTGWSEEELDFLWIGVRRHGIYNWNAVLKDPKLHFLESRVAEDLAKRWDLEQRKLLNGTLFQPASLSRPVLCSSSVMNDASLAKPGAGTYPGGYCAWSQACSEFPNLAAETKLSLGDAYLQKEHSLKRNMFLSGGLGMVNLLTSVNTATVSFLGCSPIGSTYPTAGIRSQKLTRSQNTRCEWESSIFQQKSGEISSHEHQSAGPSAGSNLPHWLKEVLGAPPGPRESVLPLPVSTIAHSANLLNHDLRGSAPFPNIAEPSAPKDARGRGILKRKSLASGKSVGGLRVSDMPSANEPWMGPRLGSLPSLGLAAQKPESGVTSPDQNVICDLNKKISGPGEPPDLVVIDSDASSEETISDDQGSRV